jgi:hypothetical protein
METAIREVEEPITVKLSSELIKQAKIYAVRKDKTLRAVVGEALEKYLAKSRE